MKTKKEYEKELSEIKFALNMKTPMRHVVKSLGTPHELKNKYLKRDEDPIFLSPESAGKIALHQVNYYMAIWYRLNQAYVPDAKQKLLQYENYLYGPIVDRLIEDEGKTMEDVVSLMHGQMEPVYCIDDLAITQMCFLIQARVNSLLYAKHWQQIPDGEAEKTKAENVFEELCANSRLPRRTAAIINKRKAAEQMKIDEFNSSFTQESAQTENGTESN
jgi:hypothetical protein